MKIVVCVPWIKPHPKFLPHFIEFYAANKAKHNLRLHWQMYRALHNVQASAVELARKCGASHILFTEDDQWGFPVDGLDVLLEADKDVIGLPTTFKEHPFLPMCMRKKDPSIDLISGKSNLLSFDRGSGPDVQPTDLITWAFTLVKSSVFDRIRDPFEIWGECPTDSYFCQYCDEAGIERYIHFGGWIEHGDVPRDKHVFYRRMNESIQASRRAFGSDSIMDENMPVPSLEDLREQARLIEEEARR